MRYYVLVINFILLFITLANAGSIFQKTFESVSTLEEDLFNNVIRLMEDEPMTTKDCKSCLEILNAIKRLSMFPERVQIAAMTNICKRTQQVDNEVCEGVIREQGPVIRKVFRTMDMSGRDGLLLCASVVNACPYPDVSPWKVSFPKEKPVKPYIHKPSNKTTTVLHLSDWHIDPQYEEGAETKCDKPICCRKAYNKLEIKEQASSFGSFQCDSPLSLIESMLIAIEEKVPNPAFAILTGDIPPHEVWDTLPTDKTQAIQDSSYDLLHLHFDIPFLIGTKLYPSIGNHEAAPTNLFPLFDSNIPRDSRHDDLTMTWLYDSLKRNWAGWIQPDHLLGFHQRSGSYISHPLPGLKLISLNTNFCYNLNWWLYEQPTRHDPNGILKWLVSHLQESEDQQQRVWIVGHTPPGDSSCLHDYANYFHQVVERYSHVIAGQFYGHTHRDELQLFYKEGSQNASDAISISYLAPSITPFPDLNPGFRSYSIDTGNFEVVDSHTYIANLEDSINNNVELSWYKEYSAKETYDSFDNPYKPLTPAWWHKVTEKMEKEEEGIFDRYWLYRYKSSPLTPECDKECRENVICGMRAGKSELRCDYDPSSSTPRKNVFKNKEKDACGISILKKN